MSANGRYLTFSLGAEHYAIPLSEVREVIAAVAVTPLPNVDASVVGIVNLRGDVVTIIDLRVKFRMNATPPNPKTAFVILDVEGRHLGVVVDAVNGVVGFAPADVEPAPAIRAGLPRECLTGVVNQSGRMTWTLNLVAAFEPVAARRAA